MSLLLPGMYVPVDSALHRLDPRLKMAAALGLMVLPFTAHSPASYGLLAVLMGGLAVMARAPLVPLLRTLSAVFWLGLFMFAYYLFATPGRPLLAVGDLAMTDAGLLAGGVQVFRLCLLVVVSALLTYTTSPGQLAHGLETLLSPLTRLGFPVRDVTLVLTIALRFVPTVLNELETITRAQEARGLDVRSGGPWQRIRGTVPVFVPMVLAAMRRAEDLAAAMDTRAFRSTARPTRLTQLSLGRAELLAAVAMLAVGLAILGLERWL